MILGTGLVLGALVITVVGPRYLRRLVSSVSPAVALVAWMASAATAVLAGLVGALVLAVPGAARADGLIGMARVCVNAVGAGRGLPWLHATGVVLAVVSLAALARVMLVGVLLFRTDQRLRVDRLALLRTVARDRDGVLWLEDGRPLAFSVAGRPGAVVATDGVGRLAAARCAAVLAHERAHLRGHHHQLVLLAETAARALPLLPLCRDLPAAVRVLVEGAADDAAAARCGADVVSGALGEVAHAAVPTGSLGAADYSVDARQLWLNRRPDRSGRRSTAARMLVAAVSTMPALASVAGSAGMAAVACLTG